MTTESYALAADIIGGLHILLVAFVFSGQVLIFHGWYRGWHWTRHFSFRLSHLVIVGFVVLETWVGFGCPLTLVESWLRQRAGQTPYGDAGFVGEWVQQLLSYPVPSWMFTALYTGFALLVLVSFVLYPPRRNLRWKARSKHAK